MLFGLPTLPWAISFLDLFGQKKCSFGGVT
jgi:hypothetical protein